MFYTVLNFVSCFEGVEALKINSVARLTSKNLNNACFSRRCAAAGFAMMKRIHSRFFKFIAGFKQRRESSCVFAFIASCQGFFFEFFDYLLHSTISNSRKSSCKCHIKMKLTKRSCKRFLLNAKICYYLSSLFVKKERKSSSC